MSMIEEKAEITPPGRWQRIGQEYRRSFSIAFRSPATWFFVAVLLAALVILALKRSFDAILNALPVSVAILLLALLTIALTDGVHQLPPIETRCSRPRLWWQIVILLIVALFATYRGIVFNVFGAFRIPLLYPLARWSANFFGRQVAIFGQTVQIPGNLIATPVLYFLIPVALLLLLGASWRELGLGRGYRNWRVTLFLSFLPLVALVIFLVTAATSLVTLVFRLIGNTFQNGFFEEFLFRGALMTRLSYLIRGDWGLVLSSLMFGLFHIGLQTGALHGDWLAGAAYAIIDQAIFGLAMAIIFLRTRNLLASSVFHVLLDTV